RRQSWSRHCQNVSFAVHFMLCEMIVQQNVSTVLQPYELPKPSLTVCRILVGMQLTEVKGVGPELAKKFAVLGVRSVDDLIHNYPRRYDDYSEVVPIQKLRPG